MLSEAAIPVAYFITFNCYGTWLHGEKPTSVDRLNNTPETNFLSFNSKRARLVKKLMSETPYFLDESRRHILLQTIIDVCSYRQWVLLAAHVRTNHVHCVIHSVLQPEQIMNTIKSYASRNLNNANLDGGRVNRWARHGSHDIYGKMLRSKQQYSMLFMNKGSRWRYLKINSGDSTWGGKFSASLRSRFGS